MSKFNLAIDFDQTIHDKLHPIKGRKMGAPLPDAKQSIRKLRRKYNIIIHTTMANTESGKQCVADWMNYYKIPYDDIVPKPNAKYYIDDKAIFFDGWKNVLEIVN